MTILKWYITTTLLCIPYLYMIILLHSYVMEPLLNSFDVPFNTSNYVDIANTLTGNDVWYTYNDVCILPRVATVLLASWFYITGSIIVVGSYLWSTGNIPAMILFILVISYAFIK